MKFAYIFLVIALFVAGCVKVTAPATDDTSTGTDDTGSSDDTATTTQKQCDEAINYQVLIDALPTEVNGFVAGEPDGTMLTFTDPSTQNTMRYSTASVTLEKDDKNIDITLTDTCYVSYLSAAWLGFYEMEGTDGYLKKTTIEGNPGWHQYQKSSNSYDFNLFVKDRIIVTVDGGNDVPDSDVEAAAKAVDYASIAGAID